MDTTGLFPHLLNKAPMHLAISPDITCPAATEPHLGCHRDREGALQKQHIEMDQPCSGYAAEKRHKGKPHVHLPLHTARPCARWRGQKEDSAGIEVSSRGHIVQIHEQQYVYTVNG